jgi:DNA-binding response OmpR family regulator
MARWPGSSPGALLTSFPVLGSSLLVVEDDEAIGRSLVMALEGQGATVAWARDGTDALRLAATTTDLVLLDLGLPDIDGVEVCRRLRDRYPPLEIVVVTARSEEIDIVLGLDAGADDYIVKPFRLAELLARLRARLRRQQSGEPDVVEVGTARGHLHLDLASRRCRLGDEEVELRTREFDLLAALATDAGRVVPRRRLMADVWDLHFDSTTKTLDMHVSALRRKLDGPGTDGRGTDGPGTDGRGSDRPSLITTVRSVGYRLEDRT